MRLTGRAIVVAVMPALLACVGCASNKVEMPRQTAASQVAAGPTAPIGYAEARCFLYRRGAYKEPTFAEYLFGDARPPRGRGPETYIRFGVPAGTGPPPLLARTLVLGETFGFERDTAGRLVAIAGEERIPLEDGRYAWEIVPTKYTAAQHAGRAALGVTGVILLGFGGPRT